MKDEYLKLRKEEENYIKDLIIEIEKAKLKVDEKYGEVDTEIEVFVYSYYVEGEIKEIKRILKPSRESYCSFCGEPTYYFDSKRNLSLCALCYSKINEGKHER